LIEAHIIPRCFCSSLRDLTGPILQLSIREGTFPRATQTGEYDRPILCAECDNVFSPFDEYACKILLQELDPKSIFQGPDGTRRWYAVERFDYARLKLLFLSVLWRMSVFIRPAYANVTLGSTLESQMFFLFF
jgi:hypothetical protein